MNHTIRQKPGTMGDAMRVLEQTSRTFYIPIYRMPPGLKEATTSAYLCMRAIDEIEDHPSLTHSQKAKLLQAISVRLQSFTYDSDADIVRSLDDILSPYTDALPEVSLRLGEWAGHAPAAIAPRIIGDTIAMADRMAYWASVAWTIKSRGDLDAYTYSVAATVGLLMCDVAAWFDGTQMDRANAVHFGRALQVTNIVRNRSEDLARGVDFYPPGWTNEDVQDYAAQLLDVAARYAETLPEAPFTYFIKIPLALAQATLTALGKGEDKLTREAVLAIVNK